MTGKHILHLYINHFSWTPPLLHSSSAIAQTTAYTSPTTPTPLETPYTIESPPKKPPFPSSTIAPVESIPCLISYSKGKGKMKWIDIEDDIPLAQLKKSRHEDTLSPLEIAAYSFTQLQHVASSTSPVHDFMEKPLQEFPGRIIGFFP
jgi:hypothetical protein